MPVGATAKTPKLLETLVVARGFGVIHPLAGSYFSAKEVLAMNARTIGRRLFTDGVPRPVHQDDRGQFIVEDGERVDGVWLVPEEDQADTPVMADFPGVPCCSAPVKKMQGSFCLLHFQFTDLPQSLLFPV